MSRCCRRYVERNFTLQQQADKCLALYRELLSPAPAGAPAASRNGNPGPADAAERFQKALPLMLRHLLTLKPEEVPLPPRPELGPKDLLIRAEFLKWTKRATEAAAADRLSHSRLMTRLEEELVVVRGTLPAPNKARLLLHRALDTWKQCSR
jgi:hypothetical protein